MSIYSPRQVICSIIFFLGALIQLPAQTEADARIMNDALQLRAGLAVAVAGGKVTSAGAISQLRAASTPMGLKMEAEAGFALAAVDIGQRLVAAGKPIEAEPFFHEAEKSLDAAIGKTPDSAARDKAFFQEQRAFLRAGFLNKMPEAKADLAKAVALQPEDKRLQRQRDSLPSAEAVRKVVKPLNP